MNKVKFDELFRCAVEQGYYRKRSSDPFFKIPPYSWYEDMLYTTSQNILLLDLIMIYKEQMENE